MNREGRAQDAIPNEQAWPQCGILSAPSTTWSDGNGSWAVAGNWTGGTPNASTNACILDGTSTVTVDATANANGLQIASGNSLNINSGASLSLGSVAAIFGAINNSGTLNYNTLGQFIFTPYTGTITNASGAILNSYG